MSKNPSFCGFGRSLGALEPSKKVGGFAPDLFGWLQTSRGAPKTAKAFKGPFFWSAGVLLNWWSPFLPVFAKRLWLFGRPQEALVVWAPPKRSGCLDASKSLWLFGSSQGALVVWTPPRGSGCLDAPRALWLGAVPAKLSKAQQSKLSKDGQSKVRAKQSSAKLSKAKQSQAKLSRAKQSNAQQSTGKSCLLRVRAAPGARVSISLKARGCSALHSFGGLPPLRPL